VYRRILVAVDGSATSKLALRHALGLGKDQRARVRLLNVIEDVAIAQWWMDIPRFIESMKVAGKKALDEGAALAKKAGVNAATAMVEARGRHVSDMILGDAKTFRADVIVMGTHGLRGLNRLLLGSDAERVLRDAPVPVLLVRAQQPRRTKTRRK